MHLENPRYTLQRILFVLSSKRLLHHIIDADLRPIYYDCTLHC